MIKKFDFIATEEGNALFAEGIQAPSIGAVIGPVPDGTSEDWGYLALKRALLPYFPGAEFLYDGQEEHLAPDASAEGVVTLHGIPGVCIDNRNVMTLDELTDEEIGNHWDALVYAMDDEIREQVHAELAPCTNREFLGAYLGLATDDLWIG